MISARGEKDLGENFQVEDYEESGSKTEPKLSISATVDNNLYNLQLTGKAKNIRELTDNDHFRELKTQFESFLPDKTGERGEKIAEALFKHFGADTKLMSSKPGHRYDLKIEMPEKDTDVPLKLLRSSPKEILAEIKTSKDDYASIRSLTVNQAQRFQILSKDQKAIIAKVVLNDNLGLSFIKTEEIFKDYPPKFIENEDGFAVLKPDLEKSKDRHSPYSKIYLFSFDELRGKNKSGALKAPATISQLELSVNLNEVKDRIAKSKGREIDLESLGPNITDLERSIYFANLKKLKEVEQKLTKVNSFENSLNNGFAETFRDRSDLRKQRQDIMKNLLITQLTKNNPLPNLELIEYYSSSLNNVTKRPHITTSNPDINENIFIFKNKQTGEIKPYEIMCFSPADPVQQYTQGHLTDRSIFKDLDNDDISKLAVRVAFYDNSKIYLFKEDLPKKVLKKLGEFEDLNNVNKGVYYIKDSLFRALEPIALHLRPEIMLKHSFV